MKLAGHVPRGKDEKCVQNFSFENPNGNGHIGRLLNLISEEVSVEKLIGCIWLGTRSGGGLFRTRY